MNNSFHGQPQFKEACISLLESLKPYQSGGGARILLPIATSTHFDATAAQLEGFARPLWAVAALVHGGCLTDEQVKELVVPYARGLANGTDPSHPEYWGPVGNKDQSMHPRSQSTFGSRGGGHDNMSFADSRPSD